MKPIIIEPLSTQAFAPFGDVIEIRADHTNFAINAGTTQRFHDLSTIITRGANARPIISMARARPFSLPLKISMLERHPNGSQMFFPLNRAQFLVVVAPDIDGVPGYPRAFMAAPGQGINYFANTWHAVLTALDMVTDFLVVDREGAGENLETHDFEVPYLINP